MNNINLCNLKINKKIDTINPDQIKFIEDILNIFKITEIGYVKIKHKKYILKKEFFVVNFPLLSKIYDFFNLNINEYDFYKKYEKKIIKYNFTNSIQIPIKYKICKTYNIYIFKKNDYDLTSNFLKKQSHKQFNDILQQTIKIMYFLNHTLKVFHNDIHQGNKLRNFMVNKRKVVLIDFGLYGSTNKIGQKNNLFYNLKTIKYFYIFTIRSELLIVLYMFLINYYTKKDINFKKLYLYFYDKIKNKTLKDLDKCILKNVF
jgi:hypothetical protein